MASGACTQLKQLVSLRHAAGDLDLFARTPAQSQLAGSVKTHFRGRGIDFEEVRKYQPGDEIRAIDWRVTARTGDAHTKLYREDREQPVLLAIDQRLTMGFGSRYCFKSVQAAEVAALLAWAALKNNDRIGGLVFDDQSHTEIRPRRSHHSVLQLINAIHLRNHQCLENSKHGRMVNRAHQLGNALTELRRITRPGSSLFIISDFIGLDEDGVKQLHYLKRHNDVNAIFISDPMERELPGRGNSLFTDGSNKLQFDTAQREPAKMFARQFEQRANTLKQQLATRGIPTIPISTEDNALAMLSALYHRSRSSSLHRYNRRIGKTGGSGQ